MEWNLEEEGSMENIFFNETPGRLVVSVSPENRDIFDFSPDCQLLGRVTDSKNFVVKKRKQYCHGCCH